MNKISVLFYNFTICFSSIALQLFGDFDSALITLLIFMLLDLISGLIVAINHKSLKSENKAVSSLAMWKGISKKIITLLLVVVAYRIDIFLSVDFIRNCVIATFIINECLSIFENATMIGIKVPKFLVNILDVAQIEISNKGDIYKNGSGNKK